MEFPCFMQLVQKIQERDPFQKKAIRAFLARQDAVYWRRAESFSENLLGLIEKNGLTQDYIADSYLKMCKNMLSQQVVFKRTGLYSCADSKTAFEKVYSSEMEMSSYMYGVAISQFLWPNHYAMFHFFMDTISRISNVEKYLEIGPGHGLFLVEAMRQFSNARFSAVDISPVSLRISKEIVDHFTGGKRCEFQISDVQNWNSASYDFISICEVLEHLDQTMPLLKRLHAMLAPGGHMFITTCANCPAIDHTYLYKSVHHVRRELSDAGFMILADISLPVENKPEHLWEEERVEVNYAALLTHSREQSHD